MLYKTIPVFKEYIWAGNKLKNVYHKKTELNKISESFEFSLNELGISGIETNLKDLNLKEYFDYASPGKNLDSQLPNVLIKLIDSGDDLSVQVHPSDEYAKKNYDKYGKTEMWYIVDSDKELGGYIYLGFNDNYTLEEVKEALENGTILSMLNKIDVNKGDTYLIPSGTIHAIGKGVTLYEIQENSDLTFRLYDYDRVDKDGNKRQLHIKESLEVVNLKKYDVNKKPLREKTIFHVLSANKYFELLRIDINDHFTLYNNENSFNLITVLSGNPKLGDFNTNPLESYYLDPSSNAEVNGKCSLLIARVPKLSIGLDVGGTSIKGIIIDDLGNIVSRSKVKTEGEAGLENIVNKVAESVDILTSNLGMVKSDFKKLGIGFPGNINSDEGVVVLSNNLGIKNANLRDLIEEKVGMSVIIENDANCAALGEYKFTPNRKYHDMALITLGTGLGSGFIVDSKLFKGGQHSTTELGHIKVKSDNFMCTCGQYGCLESLTSLRRIKFDTDKLRQDPANNLETIKEDDPYVTIFYMADSNEAAIKYLFKYLNNLLLGLLTVANLFQPEVICLGGGVTIALQRYIPYLEKRLNHIKYGGMDAPYIKVVKAKLENDAGAYGACALTFEE